MTAFDDFDDAEVDAGPSIREALEQERGDDLRLGDPPARSRAILESWTDEEQRVNYRFTLPGIPRTKKNSSQASRTGRVCHCCKLRTGPARVFPSVAFREYQGIVSDYVATKPELKLLLSAPVAMCALVYRERNAGDYFGFTQALGDILQHCGIVLNDRLIAHADGTRLLKDADNPRVEITLTVLAAGGPKGEGQ